MFEIKMLAGLVPSESWEEGSVPGFSPSFWWLHAFLGFQIAFSLGLRIVFLYMSISVSQFPLL